MAFNLLIAIIMKNTFHWALLLVSIFMSPLYSVAGQGGALEKCLSNTNYSTQSCVEQHMKIITLDHCFTEADKIKSDLAKENMRQFCFYKVSEFPTLKSCLIKAEKMQLAVNHDDAMFECVRQFRNKISSTHCHQISEKMRYPEKQRHLERNCTQL